MGIINRQLKQEVIQMSREYPVVTLMGPRQSGKTTLVRDAFPEKAYVNLETPDIRQLAREDPQGFMRRYSQGAIFDEIQRAPSLLSYIQVMVDEQAQNGRYVLTGSHQLALHQEITQSLAGRTALLTLLPLSFSEVSSVHEKLDPDELLYTGFLPRIYDNTQQPTKAYRNYLQTYIERDVRQLINVRDLSVFQKFMTLCAARVGQLVNYDDISRELGLSNHTIKHWFSLLEASFILVRLQPYFANINKRLIKSPKLYFVEPGLACYLLGIESKEQVSRDPLRGYLFENMVVLELMKSRLNRGLDPHLYFYRDQQQHEVDVIYQESGELIPIEIKSSMTYTQQFAKELDYFSQLFPKYCRRGYVVYAGTQSQSIGWRELINFLDVSRIVTKT